MKVHDTFMHESSVEKYLGDQINKNAKHASTIAKRRAKSYGIISGIIQMLDVIPDKRSRIKLGLLLRKSWFVNAIIVNVEAWHNDISMFINLDHYLMRKINGAHCKVPVELLNFETKSILLYIIFASQRVNYLHYIVTKP